MDGFSYTNMFDTKGIEYLVIIAFLLLIIPFWIILNRKPQFKEQLQTALGTLSAGLLRVPGGLFYSRNHAWTIMEKSGEAVVGLDDLLLHITGEVRISNKRVHGEQVRRGDVIAEIGSDGRRLKILSPLTGTIARFNTELESEPHLLNSDPYGKGWICKVIPSAWVAETSSYLMAEEAVAWTKKELERFKDFIAFSIHKLSPEPSMVQLQDGGELCDKPLSGLPSGIWDDFQESFLNRTC